MKRKRGMAQRFGKVERWQSDGMAGGGSRKRGVEALLGVLGRWATTRPDGEVVATVDQVTLCGAMELGRRRLCELIAFGVASGLIYTTRELDPLTGWLGVNTYHVVTLTQWLDRRRKARSHHVHRSAHLPAVSTDVPLTGVLAWYEMTTDADPDPPWQAPPPSPYVIAPAHSPQTDATLIAVRDALPPSVRRAMRS